MPFKNGARASAADCPARIEALREKLAAAEAILVGAGAGLSAAAGLASSGERFERHFADFSVKYGIEDMCSGDAYPFATPEEYWAWWSRHIFVNRCGAPVGQPYRDLLALLEGADYFVLAADADHPFRRAGFDDERLFYAQGDYGLWRCSESCHEAVPGDEMAVRRMFDEQRGMRVPSALVPRCPRCGAPMAVNLRAGGRFVEYAGWLAAKRLYDGFLRAHRDAEIVYLELGADMRAPGIVKVPFWQMTAANPRATYACVNRGGAFCPAAIADRSLCLDIDVGEALSELLGA